MFKIRIGVFLTFTLLTKSSFTEGLDSNDLEKKLLLKVKKNLK